MKKTTFVLFSTIIIISIFLFKGSNISSLNMLTFLSKDVSIVQKFALSFFEDLKFKDFDSAAKYHSLKDQKKVNIPKLIEKLFKVKPEFLDIMEYKILEISLDSSKKRARVKMKAKVNILNSGKIKNPEVILYFHKKDEKWYMELESSLR